MYLESPINFFSLCHFRSLESVVTEHQSLASHKDTVTSMIKECDNRDNQHTSGISSERGQSTLSQNVNHSVEEMRQRVSKIFNKPTSVKPSTLQNLPGLFKKK